MVRNLFQIYSTPTPGFLAAPWRAGPPFHHQEKNLVVVLNVQQQWSSPLKYPSIASPREAHWAPPHQFATVQMHWSPNNVVQACQPWQLYSTYKLKTLKGGLIHPSGTDLFTCPSNFHRSCERLFIVEGTGIHRIEESLESRSGQHLLSLTLESPTGSCLPLLVPGANLSDTWVDKILAD